MISMSGFRKFFVIACMPAFVLYSGSASASLFGIHNDPIAPVILGVTGILLFALVGRFIARKLGQPSVLGELVMGVLLGNVGYWLGFDFIHVLREGPAIFDVVHHCFMPNKTHLI